MVAQSRAEPVRPAGQSVGAPAPAEGLANRPYGIALRTGVFAVLLLALFPLDYTVGWARIYTLDGALVPLACVFAVGWSAWRRAPIRWRPAERVFMAFLAVVVVGSFFSLYPPHTVERVIVLFRVAVFYLIV